MTMAERLRALAKALREVASGARPRGVSLHEIVHGGEGVSAVQMRPTRWLDSGEPDPTSYRVVD